MKLFGGILTLVVAAVISAVAAYFSIVGLAAIFAASYWAVVTMGVALETGKLVAAGWLHSNWHNKAVNKLHKSYMICAIVVLMAITGLGIYGFLSKGYLEQQAASGPVAMEVAQKEARIEQLTVEVQRYETRQNQLDTAVNAIIASNPNGGLRARRQQTSERAQITKGIEEATTQINAINQELLPLKLEVAAVDAKLGPIKYAASAIGKEDDPDSAVRIIILMLMFAFDPLAIVLVISAMITIHDARQMKPHTRSNPDPEDSAESLDSEVPTNTEASYQDAADPTEEETAVEVAHDPADEEPVATEDEPSPVEAEGAGKPVIPTPDEDAGDDREKLIDILEKNPDLLQDMIDAVKGTDTTPAQPSWANNIRIPIR